MNKLEIENKLKNNKLPEGWVKVKLGSLLIEPKERNITNKKLLVFSISNVKGFVLQDEYFSHNIHSKKTTNYKVFKENYFGYNSARINVGSIALSEKQREGLLSPMYVIFKTKSTLNPKYLKYFIQTSHFKNNVINNVAGSVRESLNYSSLEMFDFIYPISISEQKRIAEILETFDETIEKTDAIIEKYKRIKQGLMQDLLTKGIDENGQIRNEEIHKFKDSPLGRIPEDWEVKRIIDAIGVKKNLIIAGPFGSNLKVSDYKKKGIPLIRLQNIEENKFIDKDIKYISKKKAKELYYHSFKNGDVVLAKLGIPVGKTCIIPRNLKFGIVVADVVRIRVIDEYSDKEFITYILNFNTCRKRLNMEIIGTTRPRVNLTQIRSLQLPLPSLPEQKRIAGILSQIDKTIEKKQNYKEKLERIKQGLMEDLLTGKVRVLNVN